MAASSLCYDIEGNTVDCGSGDAVGLSTGVSAGDVGAGLTLTNNPVAASVGTPSTSGGTSLGSSLLSFFSSVTPAAITAATGTSTSGVLRQQVNPATGQLSYYNPATGQYVGTVPGGSTFSGLGSSSFILVIFALVIAFFAFGGSKKLAAA